MSLITPPISGGAVVQMVRLSLQAGQYGAELRLWGHEEISICQHYPLLLNAIL
jgi:hypothetical protein